MSNSTPKVRIRSDLFSTDERAPLQNIVNTNLPPSANPENEQSQNMDLNESVATSQGSQPLSFVSFEAEDAKLESSQLGSQGTQTGEEGGEPKKPEGENLSPQDSQEDEKPARLVPFTVPRLPPTSPLAQHVRATSRGLPTPPRIKLEADTQQFVPPEQDDSQETVIFNPGASNIAQDSQTPMVMLPIKPEALDQDSQLDSQDTQPFSPTALQQCRDLLENRGNENSQEIEKTSSNKPDEANADSQETVLFSPETATPKSRKNTGGNIITPQNSSPFEANYSPITYFRTPVSSSDDSSSDEAFEKSPLKKSRREKSTTESSDSKTEKSTTGKKKSRKSPSKSSSGEESSDSDFVKSPPPKKSRANLLQKSGERGKGQSMSKKSQMFDQRRKILKKLLKSPDLSKGKEKGGESSESSGSTPKTTTQETSSDDQNEEEYVPRESDASEAGSTPKKSIRTRARSATPSNQTVPSTPSLPPENSNTLPTPPTPNQQAPSCSNSTPIPQNPIPENPAAIPPNITLDSQSQTTTDSGTEGTSQDSDIVEAVYVHKITHPGGIKKEFEIEWRQPLTSFCTQKRLRIRYFDMEALQDSFEKGKISTFDKMVRRRAISDEETRLHQFGVLQEYLLFRLAKKYPSPLFKKLKRALQRPQDTEKAKEEYSLFLEGQWCKRNRPQSWVVAVLKPKDFTPPRVFNEYESESHKIYYCDPYLPELGNRHLAAGVKTHSKGQATLMLDNLPMGKPVFTVLGKEVYKALSGNKLRLVDWDKGLILWLEGKGPKDGLLFHVMKKVQVKAT